MPKIARRSERLGRSTKNSSSKRPLRINSGGSAVTLFDVAAMNTGAVRSCIQERNDPSRRDETPASDDEEDGALPAKTFSSSSIHRTAGASASATRNSFLIRF